MQRSLGQSGRSAVIGGGVVVLLTMVGLVATWAALPKHMPSPPQELPADAVAPAAPGDQLAAISDTAHRDAKVQRGHSPDAVPAPDQLALAEESMPEHPFPRRMPAPSLDGGLAWLNVGGPLDLKQLRGKFVLLDFWTYCCINCMHVLPELKKLERAYPNELVVIGVHSAKFDTEQETDSIRDAILRYEIEHPVINDARHVVWNKYFCRSWPSLRIIDPQGYLIAGHSGEIEFEALDEFFKQALPYYRQIGALDETPLRFDLARYQVEPTPLRFPGKVLADEPGDRLFIADSNHNRIVITRLDGTLLDVIGSGEIGATDGPYATAQFDHPQGMALAAETLYVADTENHLLRKIDLNSRQVTTIAGTGQQGRNPWLGRDPAGPIGTARQRGRFVGKPGETAINSPWALWIHKDDLYIAMAGPHQIWKMPLDESEIGPYAGNGREDIVDGPLLPREPYAEGFASFAQPSGLASDGRWLYVADSEGSSIRAVPFNPRGEVRTIVGSASQPFNRLFTFGDIDGEGDEVRLQHALGVVYYDGQLYITDTYNNKVKVIDPEQQTCHTLAGTGEPGRSDDPPRFAEPAGIAAAAGRLFVADTNNHLIRTIDLATRQVGTLEIEGLQPPQPQPVQRPRFEGAIIVEAAAATIRAIDGVVQLELRLDLPEGYKLNPLAPTGYLVEDAEGSSLIEPEGPSRLTRIEPPALPVRVRVPVRTAQGSGTLRVGLEYYYCQEGAEGLCKAGAVVWTVSLRLSPDATQQVVPLEYQVP